MSFSNLEEFVNLKSDRQFNSIIASLSCVVIKALLTTSKDIELLVEFVHGFEIQMKHLVINVPIIQNYTVLQDQIMNYNARIYHDSMIIFKVTPYFKTFYKRLCSRWENDITLPYTRKEICNYI